MIYHRMDAADMVSGQGGQSHTGWTKWWTLVQVSATGISIK